MTSAPLVPFVLSVLAFAAGAAAAQTAASSVTIYGIVDQGIIKMNNGTSNVLNSGGGARGQWNVKQGAAPRLGFRGVEDIGGGVQAFFHLEHRFLADDGSASTPFWTGRSVVGLRGAAGEITIGRDYLPAFWPGVAVDPWGWDTVGQMGLAYTWARYAGGDAAGIRNSNAITYRSPAFGGLTASLQTALGEGGATRGRSTGANLIYSAGPVYLGFGFDTAKHTTGSADARLLLVSGAYNFGVAKLSGVIARSRSTANVTTRSMFIGGSAPIGPGQLRAAIGRIDPAGANNNSTKASLGYHYSLSKRTTLYTDLGSAKTDGLTRSTGVDLGVKHVF